MIEDMSFNENLPEHNGGKHFVSEDHVTVSELKTPHNNYRYHILHLLNEAKYRKENFAKTGYGDTRVYVSFDRREINILIALLENELGSVERTLGNECGQI